MHDWRGAWRQTRHLPAALAVVWRASRGWTVAWAALLAAQGVLPLALVFQTRALVDSLAPLLGKGTQAGLPQTTWLWGALMVATLLLDDSLKSAMGWVRAAQAELVKDHVSGSVHVQAFSLDLSCFDTAEFYDGLHRARVDALSRPVALLESLGGLVQNGITLAAMAFVLLRFGPSLPLALLVSTLPALGVTLKYSWRFHEWRVKNTPDVRKAHYLDSVMTQQHSAQELRLFELGPHLEKTFQDLRARLRSEQEMLNRGEAAESAAAGAFGLLVMAAGLASMATRAAAGHISMGELALFTQAFAQGQRMMRALLGNAGELQRNLAFLENLFDFLGRKPAIELPPSDPVEPVSLNRELAFRGVTFRYPGSARPALESFDLTIPAGKIVAVVGENGAGKSTLIKLACRFYDPESGAVLLDGRDLKELAPAALRRHIAVLFQEPVRYQETVASNIAFGDLAAAPTLDRIQAAARAGGAEA
ncbi:MAG: ABC transporter ATP-binding protein, partial [Candidatus Wallbacteria bacterium]|nr:ABC transporter ATP-binding protein [Candidatus Wallbacteria bacterium]